MKPEQKQFWTGIAIGAGVGGAIAFGSGYAISKKKTENRKRREYYESLREARHKAYRSGMEEATIRAQRWIDENVKTVDADDPQGAMEVINNYFKASEEALNASDDGSKGDIQENTEAVKRPLEGQREAFLKDKDLPDVSTPVENMAEPPRENEEPEETEELAQLTLDQNNQVLINFHGEVIASYPRELFFRDDGESYGETQIRARLVEYEKNLVVLRKVWMAFGWGNYFPDPSLGAPTAEEMDAWDLEIDELEAKTIERQRMMDNLERYREHPEDGARIISRQEFNDESFLPKIFVDYYDVDNIFVESTDFDKELDAFDNFSVSDGKELFGKRRDDDDDDEVDPDIVHVKNFKMNFVAEITRFHKSFASVKDGSAYLDGGSV